MHKNVLHFYTLTMKYQRNKRKKQSYLLLPQNPKDLGTNLTEEMKASLRTTVRH